MRRHCPHLGRRRRTKACGAHRSISMSSLSTSVSRRRLLHFIAGSPLFMYSGAARAQGVLPPDPMVWAPRDLENLIANPKDALSVFDFEPVMRKNVPPAHFGYMATGLDD